MKNLVINNFMELSAFLRENIGRQIVFLLLMVTVSLAVALLFKSNNDGKRGIEKQLQAAEAGDVNAQVAVAQIYWKRADKDITKAMYWLQKAAEQNYAPAQESLAARYYEGDIVPQDLNKAFEWYSKSANQGESGSQYFLAFMLQNGEGVAQNTELAMEWVKKAAEQGHAAAQYRVGINAWEHNKHEDAVFWLEKAAEKGYAEAKWMLSGYYYAGEGVSKDIKKSRELLLQASENSIRAQYWLGVLYLHGNDMEIEKNGEKGIALIRQAAQQGLTEAQVFLDEIHDNGGDTPDSDK